MNRELELKLQAYLDGELPLSQARRVEDLLESDTEAGRLLQELRWTKSVLEKNEPIAEIPVSRTFYWSKIERAILKNPSAERYPRHLSVPSIFHWKRWLAPLAAVAAAVVTILGVLKFFDFESSRLYPPSLVSVESPSEAMGAYSFRSQKERVFVIWLYNQSPESRADLTFVNDLIIQ